MGELKKRIVPIAFLRIVSELEMAWLKDIFKF